MAVGGSEIGAVLCGGGEAGGGVGGGVGRPPRPFRIIPARLRVHALEYTDGLSNWVTAPVLALRWCPAVAGLARNDIPVELPRGGQWGVGTPRTMKSCGPFPSSAPPLRPPLSPTPQ